MLPTPSWLPKHFIVHEDSVLREDNCFRSPDLEPRACLAHERKANAVIISALFETWEVDTKIKRTEMLKGKNTLLGVLMRLVLQKLTHILLHTSLTFLPGSKVHSGAIKTPRGMDAVFLYYIFTTISRLVFKVRACNNDLWSIYVLVR